jgi:hypothetical protein
MMKDKHWFKFYPDKWMGDIELRMCTPMARALLIDLMAISFPTGIFSLKKREEKKQFLRQIGYTPAKFERSLNELLDKSRVVFDEKLQKFYIPRMRKDHEIYEKSSKNGKLGGNPVLQGVNPTSQTPLKAEVDIEEEVDIEVFTPVQRLLSRLETLCVINSVNLVEVSQMLEKVPPEDYDRFIDRCKEIQTGQDNSPGMSRYKAINLIPNALQTLETQTPKECKPKRL